MGDLSYQIWYLSTLIIDAYKLYKDLENVQRYLQTSRLQEELENVLTVRQAVQMAFHISNISRDSYGIVAHC